MSKVIDEIVQALQNLGGQGSTAEILDEVEKIRSTKFSEQELYNFRSYLHIYYNRFRNADGEPYFLKLDRGIWAVNDGTHEVLDIPDRMPQVRKPKVPAEEPKVISFETVLNSLKTIKEYREFYDPNSGEWSDYVYEIFHVLGFSTEKVDSRMFFLKPMSSATRRALVLASYPSEDYVWVAPDVSWNTYLQFAANYHEVEWGIHTNGLRLNVFNYKRGNTDLVASYEHFSQIIEEENLEVFFKIFKVFASFGNGNGSERKPETTVVNESNSEDEVNWRDQVYIALRELGGEADLPELYNYIEANPLRELSLTFKATVRRVLQDYCSESSHFIGKEDLFRKVEKGRWKIV